MNKIPIVTAIEAVYLIYMYFFFQTTYSIRGAPLEKQTQALGTYFIHDTGRYQNKVCMFGKVMAIIAVLLATIRMNLLVGSGGSDRKGNPGLKKTIVGLTIAFDIICLGLAYAMNLNALVYLLPLIPLEVYLFL
jgi:hypothetical protein